MNVQKMKVATVRLLEDFVENHLLMIEFLMIEFLLLELTLPVINLHARKVIGKLLMPSNKSECMIA